MKIAILLGTDGADVRSLKTCRSLIRLGHEVHFVGWKRRPECSVPKIEGVEYHLMDLPVSYGRSTIAGQLRFTRYAARHLHELKPHVVCAVNEDNVLRACLYKGRYYDHLICDFYDSHADRFSDSSIGLRWLAKGMSYFCKSISDRLVVTDSQRMERLGKFQHKATIIQNVPEDPGAQLARQLPTGSIKILVTGAMCENRGLGKILEAAENVPNSQILAAGMPSDIFAEEVFLKHEKVDYRGLVTPQESLHLASQCDAVFAFYAPNCQNHIYASPNKLFDALSVGRPVIINSEVKMSQMAEDLSVGLICRYDDIEKLQSILQSLEPRRTTLAEFAQSARQNYLENHSWEKMEERILQLYSSLDDSNSHALHAAA